jgi:pyruvate carboxylase subunit B
VPADPELRRLVLGREEPITIRPADLLEPQVEAARNQLKKMSYEPTDESVLIYLLFPSLTPDYLRGPEPEAPSPKGPARPVSTEPVAPVADPPAATPPPPAAAAATAAEFDVEVEGEVFRVRVSGVGMTVMPGAGAGAAPGAAQASPPPRTGEGTVIAPMQGLIVKLPVKAGDDVKLGDVVAVLEAMKMQNDIVTTVAGKVREVYVKEGEVVTPSQPLLAVG